MRQWFFEDFSAGQSLPSGEGVVGAQDAAWFSAHFAPAHVDAGAFADGGAESEGVSGWYVSAFGMRLIYEAFLHHTASLGAPGVEEVDWPRAVRVGDILRLDARVSSVRASRSRPEMGLVGFHFSMTNQYGECVMRQSNVILVERRTEGAAT